MAEEANAALMAQHLAELGHRRIGHVAGDLTTETGRRRRDGFVARAAADGVAPPLVADGGFTRRGGYAAARRLLSTGDPPITGLGVANLLSGLGTLAAARDVGLRVPHDLSVVAIDEHLVADHTDPPLTTVRTPQRELGRAAARALLDAIDGREVGRIQIDVPPVLVRRRSTAAPGSSPDTPSHPPPTRGDTG
jgi:DNA-binding LacI/PurR family transcriptional regulator